jgi:hypothetical protein
MTHRKITVCAFIKGSSPKAHEERQHDWRPKLCRDKGCYGVLVDCKSKSVVEMRNRDEIGKMIAYLKKIKRED